MPLYKLQDVVVDGQNSSGKSTFRVPVHLKFVRKVGAGAYGCVASFTDTRTGDKIAVKKITNAFDDLLDGKRVLREVKLLRACCHPNIIKIMDMFPPQGINFKDIYIVTEVMETDLNRVIYSKQNLTEEHHVYFIHQVLRGLIYLHTSNVVHRDMKPNNLLVNRNCDVKICDFGLARVLETEVEEAQTPTDYVVTRWYRAPEVVLLASEYTAAIDMWSVGCILSELINRKPLVAGKDHLDQIRKIVGLLGNPTEEDIHWLPPNGAARAFLKKCPAAARPDWPTILPSASPKALEAVESMLRFDPSIRITGMEALRLKYFDGTFKESDLTIDTASVPVDWTFDSFEPTKSLLQQLMYAELASFHPEILDRDRDELAGVEYHDCVEA